MALSEAHQADEMDEVDEVDDTESVLSASAVVRHEPRSATVTVAGDLCAGTAPVLGALLDGLITDGITEIAIDVARLRICTSHGLDAIDAARARIAAGRGGCIAIENASGAVRRVFEIVGMPLDGIAR